MTEKAILEIEGKKYEFPLVRGSEGEIAIDIKTLRSATGGVITLDPGFKNTGSCTSEITFLNGEEGVLRYRGYALEELTKKACFIESAYLTIFGELPTKKQLEKFNQDIKCASIVDEEMKKIVDAFPKSAHPMGVLSSLTSALTAFNPSVVDVNNDEQVYRSVVKIMAQFPVIASWALRERLGLPLNYSNNSLDYISNIMQLMFRIPTEEYKLNPYAVKALDELLILHIDHEQNCSTSTVRIVGSSEAGLFASVASGVSALWGRLHGGANQAVLEMLEAIKEDGGDVEKYIAKAKDKNDPFRLMGFGHRVYKNFDPRAKIIKQAADELFEDLKMDDPILDIAKKLEEVALQDEYFMKRKLYPNVDFYSGIIYRALGFPTEMFTVLFCLGRLPGWISQWLEMRRNNEPIGRPRQLYVGKTHRKFVDVENR